MLTYCLKRYLSTNCNVRVRFAPSPTGILHLGGLRTALYNYLFTKSRKGVFILRVEDTDQVRLVPGAIQKLQDVLSWVGLQVDEGPKEGGNYGPYIQSERLHFYREKMKQLEQNGSVYKCFCTSKRLELLRKDAKRRGGVPKYDNKCRHLDDSTIQSKLRDEIPFVLRFKLDALVEPWNDVVYGPIRQNISEVEGDPVLVKSDGFPTYHFANVVDDHMMGITHVLRGVEWQSSTSKHILLYKAFGWNPPEYGHLPLILNRDGSKLSKRHNDTHVEYFRLRGYLPESVLNLVTTIGGGFDVRDTSGMTLTQLVDHFCLTRVRQQSTRLDTTIINDLNRRHLTSLYNNDSKRAELVDKLTRVLIVNRVLPAGNDLLCRKYLDRVLRWSLSRIYQIEDLMKPEFKFIWHYPPNVYTSKLPSHASDVLKSTTSALETLDIFDKETIGCLLKRLAQESDMQIGEYMRVLRNVISGLKQGPGVAEMMSLLGKERTVNRLNRAISNS